MIEGMRKTRRKQLAECNSSNDNLVQSRLIITDYKQGLFSSNCANYGLTFFN